MSKWANLLTAVALGLLPPVPGAAQTAGQRSMTLKLVVILARHGVRSPTWTQDRLDSYSALPWPRWHVPPGNLTARGHQLLTQFGRYDRLNLAAEGLLARDGCSDAAATYLYADTDQRTIESGQALAEGLFPGCTVALHGRPQGENDPLFHPTAKGVAPADAAQAYAELSAKLLASDPRPALIDGLQQLLRGCALHAACTPQHEPKLLLPGTPTAAVRGKGDHLVDLEGPLPLASTFAEDFLLEYADGMKTGDIAWGNLDESGLRRLLELHTQYFALMHRTPALARMEASNLVSHIARTLEQAVTAQPIAQAIGPQGTKLVLLAGHDTNLAALAQLLGLHWTLDGRTDDTVPGTQLAFELWQDAHGAYSVRLAASAQTLPQLRNLQPLTLAAPPATQIIQPAACQTKQGACPWEQFQRLVEAAVDRSYVMPLP